MPFVIKDKRTNQYLKKSEKHGIYNNELGKYIKVDNMNDATVYATEIGASRVTYDFDRWKQNYGYRRLLLGGCAVSPGPRPPRKQPDWIEIVEVEIMEKTK